MTETFYFNHRVPLPADTKLTDELTIVDLLSDCGGTSLTYKARDNRGRLVVVKETYPLQSAVPLVRDGYKILFREETEVAQRELDKIAEKFNAECNNSDILCATEDTNSIFHFDCKDITEKVVQNGEFAGTIARYMCIATVSGKTLCDLQTQELSLRQALLYIKKLLFALKKMHTEKAMLHLDIKDDNVFFPDEPEETFAILLDCGSAQKIENVSESTHFSISDSFAAREVQLLKKYSEGVTRNEMAARKYRNMIGPQTDLYSVGAVAFRLVMQQAFDWRIWMQINGEDSPTQKEQLLRQELEKQWGETYPYLVDRLLRLFVRAMYFSPKVDQVKANRFQNCDEFYAEVNILLEILDQKGIHPEIIAAKSRENFKKILKNANLSFEGDPVENDTLFVPEWFPSVVKTE